MTSSLRWLDTSEHDRRRALDVIDLFSVRDTRDELGLAGVRDAWADRLVPGTSTIQTRARYFLFVPWIYGRLERKSVAASAVARRARKAELDLIGAISESDEEGLPIGARAGRGLKRLPSNIYWNGLRRLRIRRFDGSLETYHRSFGRQSSWLEEQGEQTGNGAWNPHLPPPPEDFPKRAVLRLERGEAEFLRDQVLTHAPGTLFAFLVAANGYEEGTDFPWEHALQEQMPAHLRLWIWHAEAFSVAVHGAALLYNLMLAEKLGAKGQSEAGGDAWAEDYRSKLSLWAQDVEALGPAFHSWDRMEFWQLTREINPRISGSAVLFADRWIDMVQKASEVASLVDDEHARKLIERREFALKKGRSRLRHREQLERWGGAAGAQRIDYRWGITQRLVRDVQEGLGNL